MEKKSKTMRVAPKDYWDMKGSVEKDKNVKMSEVFGKGASTKRGGDEDKKNKQSNKGKKKSKKKTTKKKY